MAAAAAGAGPAGRRRRNSLTAVVALIFALVSAVQGCGSSATPAQARQVLVLDVDGTLYEDDCLVETQIKDNCHAFARDRFGLTSEQSQAMHVEWGATVRGIVEGGLGPSREKTYTDYYNEVYPHLDMGRLGRYSGVRSGGGGGGSGVATGYGSGGDVHKGRVLEALHAIAETTPVVIASNSPVFHVKRVMTRLGLAKLKVAAFVTPERRGGFIKTEANFWSPLLEMWPRKQGHELTLVDDNALNIELAKKLGMKAFRITHKRSLADALVSFCHGPPPQVRGEDFEFDDARYIAAKNEVDRRALNQQIKQRLWVELDRQLGVRESAAVVDLGAGTLSLLAELLEYLRAATGTAVQGGRGKPLKLTYVAFESNAALWPAARARLEALGFAVAADPGGEQQHVATCRLVAPLGRSIEVTVHWLQLDFMSPAAVAQLRSLLPAPPSSESASVYTPGFAGVDLVCGGCVADLVAPAALAAQIIELAGDRGGLLYLPLTFAGATRVQRRPATNLAISDATAEAEADAAVFGAYHAHLRDMGHHLSVPHLVDRLEACGCQTLATGASPWRISREDNPYMFGCMLHFLAHGTTFRLANDGRLDLCRDWFRSALGRAELIEADNVDILARLPEIDQRISLGPGAGSDGELATVFGILTNEQLQSTPPLVRSLQPGYTPAPAPALRAPSAAPVTAPTAPPSLPPTGTGSVSHLQQDEAATDTSAGPATAEAATASAPPPTSRLVVEFTGPRELHVIREPLPLPLLEDQLVVRTACSLVSTGTELKVFRGDFDSAERQDLTIAGLDEASMSYPLRYGYSLVGEVVATGASPLAKAWLGKRVFSFSPHCSACVVSRDAVLEIPDAVSFEDAAFLPSVETALALVMEARPVLGERVAVVGQGLIGALVSGVLSTMGADVTVFDTNPERLRASQSFNPHATVAAAAASDFDVAIEVTGQGGGLQTAVDATGKGGRVVLGSWYGEEPLALRLGLRFHRSGIKLIPSQVSLVPPELRERWTKARRFDLAWRLTQQLRPSRLVVGCEGGGAAAVSLDTAAVKAAYMRLDQGLALSSLFYSHSD